MHVCFKCILVYMYFQAFTVTCIYTNLHALHAKLVDLENYKFTCITCKTVTQAGRPGPKKNEGSTSSACNVCKFV